MKKGLEILLKCAHPFTKIHLKFFGEKNSLISFIFHAVFQNKNEINSNLVYPKNIITLPCFKQLVEYFLDHNYVFVSPREILKGLNNNEKYVLITFDDGYFNNKHVLPILEEYEVPATFFVLTNYLKYKKSFWWDALYRERTSRGHSLDYIEREISELMFKKNNEIEEYLKNIFGAASLNPISDLDRPFTTKELRNFSNKKYVTIGNHTSDHSILANYASEDIILKIKTAQDMIYDITGMKPEIISYPHGKYSMEVLRISKKIGLKLGVTVAPQKNYLPIDPNGYDSMLLGRFSLMSNINLKNQFEIIRSDLPVYSLFRSYKRYF